VRLALALNRALDPAGESMPRPPALPPMGWRADPEAYFALANQEASVPESQGAPEAHGTAKSQSAYVWSAQSKIFHFLDCSHAAKISRKNLRSGDVPPPGMKLHKGCRSGR